MTLILLFLIVFVGGPLAFRGLTRGGPSPAVFRRLAVFTAFCAAAGLMLRYGFTDLWGRSPLVTAAAIALIWGAWIGILAYCTQALRRMDQGARMRRWTAVIGAAGTTVPWFGLASASLISG